MSGRKAKLGEIAGNVRDATPADTAALASRSNAWGFSSRTNSSNSGNLLRRYFAGSDDPERHWIVYDCAGVVGAASYAAEASPERRAPGTWNLYFVGALPERQGSGCGSALISHVEEALASAGAIDLLVETSGLDRFEPARSFYRKHGYRVVGRIADAYEAGDDTVVYRKRLAND